MNELRPLRAVRQAPIANEYALLPPERPLDMPTQPLKLPKDAPRVRDRMTLARAALLLLTLAMTSTFALLLYQALSIVQLTTLQAVFLVLCTLCFCWISLGTSSAILGFFAALFAPRPTMLNGNAAPDVRTALLFPVYQEDAARIAATIESMVKELIALGAGARFDVFVLSDSRTGESKARELRAVRFLRRRLREGPRIYYRARAQNTGKKAGNIADWVQRFGGGYDSFIILDADSIMSGRLVLHLQGSMAANDKAGLIQTVPRLVGSQTLFARMQQFAVSLYGPLVAAGFAAWYGRSGNYWGHNAILRTRAFAEAAGLPTLSGSPPLGGHVLSHDFVEAAFLRRAGWEVTMLPGHHGSYEGCPPTLIDVAVRDRRWAQGNMQHLRIVGSRGLPWVSRLHLGMGAYAYASSGLWALSLLVGVFLAVQAANTLPVYFPDTKTLFPVWPVIDPLKAFYLFIATIVVLLLPKVMGILLSLLRPPADVARPGALRTLAGALVETLLSILIAPIMMVVQSSALIEIMRGADSGWNLQRRDGEVHALGQVVSFHTRHVLFGIALGIGCALSTLYVFAWMVPIVAGLLLSIPLSYWTSQPAPRVLAAALATPEDLQAPPIVAATVAAYPDWQALLVKNRGSGAMPTLGAAPAA